MDGLDFSVYISCYFQKDEKISFEKKWVIQIWLGGIQFLLPDLVV